jgi:glycosyltransferase involved in cell wall biosynthesis
MRPAVSVILPVYNAEKYIAQSIQSIIDQTFTNFELIILDDGSIDNTRMVVASFTDSRIKLLLNEKNSGLAFTLNKGVQYARGQYIARMDGDDLAHPQRFEKQVAYLDNHPDVCMIDCIMDYIDENGNLLHQVNATEVTEQQIRKAMPQKNCLGHSSIMIRKNILLKYPYNHVGNEDYDLWLRLLANGYKIHKLPEKLLLYRIHDTSYTKAALNTGLHFFRQARTKKQFLLGQVFEKKKISLFTVKVFIYLCVDYATAYYKWAKNKIANLFLIL